MVTPTIEKLLVDIQKDEDFDYMQGTEITYMYQTAFDLYTVNTPKCSDMQNVEEHTIVLIH